MCLLGERGEEGVVGEKKMCSPLCFSVCSGKTELCDFSVNYPLRGSRRGHNTHNPVGGGGSVLEELRPRKEARPLGSRIWRSLETSLLNSTPADRRTYVEG